MKNSEEIVNALVNGNYLIDTHCHLDMAHFKNDLDELLRNARKCCVKKIVTIGIDLASSREAVKLARQHQEVHATIGIHPHDVDNVDEAVYVQLRELYSKNNDFIVGYGEIGLDYVKKYSEPALQRKHFSRQLDLAHELDLPIIVHNREADDDTFKLLKEAKPFAKGGIMHCFSSDLAFAEKIIDLGLYISIPGIITFKNAETLHRVAEKIPLSSMVIETDGPFLSPHPYRGKRNEPAYVLYTAARIAELRGCPVEDIAKHTTANALNLFNI